MFEVFRLHGLQDSSNLSYVDMASMYSVLIFSLSLEMVNEVLYHWALLESLNSFVFRLETVDGI